MKNYTAIDIQDVTKDYPIFHHPLRAFRYLMSFIWRGKQNAFMPSSYVKALSNITLKIERGERLGIVGRNGAGKSTLLKLLAGNFLPSSGKIRINGKIYSLLPKSVSFSLDQSVEENARQYLSYLGLSRKQIKSRIEDIKSFTELGDYFYQPVKNLSLGMRVRAEFAVATANSADIVIIDEVLGAGDIYWSEKIARRMERLCEDGITLILVSHMISQVNRYCDRAVWIERGKLVMDDEASQVTKRYEVFLERLSWKTDDIDDKTIDLNEVIQVGNEKLEDSGQIVSRCPGRSDVIISGVWFNEKAVSELQLDTNDSLSICLRLSATRVGEYYLRYLFTFWDEHGRRCAVIENKSDHITSWIYSTTQKHEVHFYRPFIGLKPNKYLITITLIDVIAAATTTNEFSTRQDYLIKSFALEVTDVNQNTYPQPLYKLRLTSDLCIDDS